MKYVLYALCLVPVSYNFCRGQNKTHLSKENTRYVTKDTVTSYGPNRITRDIIQDRKGNIWIAAFDGVFRYDGKSFTNITSKVSSAPFFSVLEDSKGNLWFGSIGSGVFLYDGKSFKNFTARDGLAGNEATCIYEDKTGNIWCGTSRYDGKSFRNYRMNGGVNSIIEDKTGKLWFATRGNTFVYDGKTFTVFTHDGKPFTNVRSIIEDKKGNIWLGGIDGLWRYDGKIFTNFTRDFVGYIYEDKKGNIWTGSERRLAWASTLYDGKPLDGWVLSRYDGKSLSNKKPTVAEIKPKAGMICGILEANDGSIWFGGSDGVYRYDGKTITNFKGIGAQK
jgi:ligand-binding sensor domain-containing protein